MAYIFEEKCKKSNRKIDTKTKIHNSKDFWTNVITKLENESANSKHYAQLNKIFKPKLLRRILKIIMKDDQLAKTKRFSHDAMVLKSMSDKQIQESCLSLLSGPNSFVRFKSLTESKHRIGDNIDFRKKLIKEIDEKSQYTNNMYMNFLKQPRNLAQKWRPKPPLTFKGMNLKQRCEVLVHALASDFVQWLKGLGGDEESRLDVATIVNLFEIGLSSHATDSLCIRIKELNAVSDNIAIARGADNCTYKDKLYDQLQRDINDIKPREAMFAFGTVLPIDMRPAPQKENAAMQWVTNKRVPERLATMAVVWEGIEDYNTTLGFCRWIIKGQSIIEPPAYLMKSGLMAKVQRNVDDEDNDVLHKKSSSIM